MSAKPSWIDRAAWCAEQILPLLPVEFGEARDARGTSIPHLRFMARQLAQRQLDSETKACRWLGYLQAGAIYCGVTTLEDEKERNLASAHGARAKTGPSDPEGWRWFAGPDDERYTVGPCPTREAAIAEAIGNHYSPDIDASGRKTTTFHVIEARQTPFSLSGYLTFDALVENICENIDSDLGDDEGTGPTEGAWTTAQERELQTDLAALIDAWQARHGIVLKPWKFSATRNARRIAFDWGASVAAVAHRTWWPAVYADESMPEGQATPCAWLSVQDGAHRFGPADDERFPSFPVAEGEIVSFLADDYLGHCRLTIGDAGAVTWAPEPPADAFLYDTDEWEQSGDGPDDFVRTLLDNYQPEPGESYQVGARRQHNDIAFRFTAQDGPPRFVPVDAVPAAPGEPAVEGAAEARPDLFQPAPLA